MEELLNERYPTSEMPQVRREFFRSAQPLPKLRDAPRVSKQSYAISHAEHGERYCGL